MADLTIESGRTLPQICAFNGSDEAPVRREEEIVCEPQWLNWLLFIPGGFVFYLFIQQLTRQQFRITYYLSNAGLEVIRRRKIIVGSVFGLSVVIFVAGSLYKLPVLYCSLLVSIPFAFWYEKNWKRPFLVKNYNSRTVTLTRLPEKLVKAYEEKIANRPGAPPKPVIKKPKPPSV